MADSTYAYKWERGGRRGPRRTKTTRSLWKHRGKRALEPEEGGYRALFLGSDGAAWSMQTVTWPIGEGKEEGEGAENEVSKKGA